MRLDNLQFDWSAQSVNGESIANGRNLFNWNSASPNGAAVWTVDNEMNHHTAGLSALDQRKLSVPA
jgi:hypothetical protein